MSGNRQWAVGSGAKAERRYCLLPIADCLARGAGLLVEHAHDVALLHDQQLLAVDLDLGAGPLAEQHLVALLDVEGHDLAALVAGTGAHCDHFALLGLLCSRVGDDDATGRLRLAFDPTYDDAIVQRTEFHVENSLACRGPLDAPGFDELDNWRLLALHSRECQRPPRT